MKPMAIATLMLTVAVAQDPGEGGPATLAQLDYPVGVSVDAAGHVFMAEPNASRIRKVDARTGVIQTLAGGAQGSGGDGGPAVLAQFANPMDIAVDAAGQVYVADMSNSRIRRIVPGGSITTYATVPNPIGIAVARDGTVYATLLNNRISRITPAGATVIAGSGQRGYAGDRGPAVAAQFSFGLSGIAVDASANIFVADSGNHRVRKVGPDGVVNTVAGTGTAGYAGDGESALDAQFSNPMGVAVAPDGNIYVADTGNNRVRRITPDGIVRTFAGNGTRGMSGNNGTASTAQLNEPVRVAVDAAGNVYIADRSNGHIRKVDAAGIITTVAGSARPRSVPGGIPVQSRP